jgi:hypothetical protein
VVSRPCDGARGVPSAGRRASGRGAAGRRDVAGAFSRATVRAAWVEIALGIAAAALVVYLHHVFTTLPLLDVGPASA